MRPTGWRTRIEWLYPLRGRAVHPLAPRTAPRRGGWIINVLLFLATAVTTTIAGAFYASGTADTWTGFFLGGWVFSVPLMSILLVHEMGHYLTGRRHRLDVTPPYFIPAIPPVGTFGAFIKIRSLISDRKVLVEVGASGPMAGSVVAIPLLFAGLSLSETVPQTLPSDGVVSFGSSLLLELLCLLRFGEFSADINVVMHPTAMAAWFGLFVTAINLLPVGQLDGGHVAYALFGPRWAFRISLATLAVMVILGVTKWHGWLVFALLTTIVGLRHPPPMDPYTPLDRTGRMVGVAAIVLFVFTFIPVPFSMLD